VRKVRSLLLPCPYLSYEFPLLGVWDELSPEVIDDEPMVDDLLFDIFQQISAIFLA
jgi:hypothetical protein